MTDMWHSNPTDDGILEVRIDRVGESVNSLSTAALKELASLLDSARNNQSVRGILFFSGKKGNFIVGADVHELKTLDNQRAALEMSQYGQEIFRQIADLSIPTVALISGPCLGGGLEFAMACTYRLADDQPSTLLGLPEVKLGLIPGWGGTVRLPRLIGLVDALPMLLTGRRLNAFQARSKGLIHDVVPREGLVSAGRRILKTGSDASKLFRKKKSPLVKRLLNSSWMRGTVLKKARAQTIKATGGHYPAPEALLDVLEKPQSSASAAYGAESEAVSQLGEHPVTKECMRLFFLQEAAKKPPTDLSVSLDDHSSKRGAVIGAGAMGGGIALLMAKKGIWTRLKDVSPEWVSNGMRKIQQSIDKDVARRRITKLAAEQALDHLSPTTSYDGLRSADIVIEAVIEDLEVKRNVFQELSAASGPKTVLATNTSSLRVSELVDSVEHPERLIGLHFFNPPAKMPLVEIIRTEHTSDEALATGLALVTRLGKTAVIVGDCAGFLVNRILGPYMNEASHLLSEVSDPLSIDRAAVAFGMPMGPIELTQLVGVGVAAHVSEHLYAAYGDRMEPAPVWRTLKEIQEGHQKTPDLIKKSKSGIALTGVVEQAISRLGGQRRQLSEETIIQRLVFPVINEAVLCLDEGIAQSADDVDLAMVFGTGFAPFRGGPLRYGDSIGPQAVLNGLEAMAADHPRLAPCDALRRLVSDGRSFESMTSRTSTGTTLEALDAGSA